MEQEQFTRYETARILGARALQIAMDAPPLLKLSDEELKELKFDAIRIAEREFEEGVLPISIHRPTPKKAQAKLKEVKEDTVSDKELIEKAKAEEKEIAESAAEMGLVNPADQDEESGGDIGSSGEGSEE